MLASRPFEALRLGSEDFSGFIPSDPNWSFSLMHVKATPTEPTIIAYDTSRRTTDGGRDGAPVRVRLVHGYNMVDCMRIKQYRVDLISDTRHRADNPGEDTAGEKHFPEQVWRLTNPSGEQTVWVTTMLRISDFGATETDTRDMAFPRVGTPDEPAWSPSGLKWSSFRHPIRNFRFYLRSKWNASRLDPLTFLRLRQPAWASDVMLTMVSEYRGASVTEETEAPVVAYVREVHETFHTLLRAHGGPLSGGTKEP